MPPSATDRSAAARDDAPVSLCHASAACLPPLSVMSFMSVLSAYILSAVCNYVYANLSYASEVVGGCESDSNTIHTVRQTGTTYSIT